MDPSPYLSSPPPRLNRGAPFPGKSSCPRFTVDVKLHLGVTWNYLQRDKETTFKKLIFVTLSISEEPVSGITCWQVFLLHIRSLERCYSSPLPLLGYSPEPQIDAQLLLRALTLRLAPVQTQPWECMSVHRTQQSIERRADCTHELFL